MLCGCYEAVAVKKPLITSNKEVLQNYFKGAVFVDNTPQSICRGIKEIIGNLEYYREKSQQMKFRIEKEWENHFNKLKEVLWESFKLPVGNEEGKNLSEQKTGLISG